MNTAVPRTSSPMAALTQVAAFPVDMYRLSASPAIIQVLQASKPVKKNTPTMIIARCHASSAIAI